MLSFPSALNSGGSSAHSIGKSDYAGSKQLNISSIFSTDSMDKIKKVMNVNLNSAVKQEMSTESRINISQFSNYYYFNSLTNLQAISGDDHGSKRYEDIYKLPIDLLASMNMYRFRYKTPNRQFLDAGEDGNKKKKVTYIDSEIVPSLFNPSYGVQVKGICPNVPLVYDKEEDINSGLLGAEDLNNCTVHELCSLSLSDKSILGRAKYKYSDFMFCKDLGKVANNHLVTLRRFDKPVGDHIFEFTNKNYRNNGDYDFDVSGEVGRLVSWFGTDDNRLEDILHYNYYATWQPLNSKIDPVNSLEDDKERGLIGMIANSVNPAYNDLVSKGWAGAQSLWGAIGSSLGIGSLERGDKNPLRNYDNNKVYTPLNTIQDTNVYQGKLVYNQEITLNFSYVARQYDNINQKSAMLDLLSNILTVTYKSGKFWGGSRKMIGPSSNTSVWKKSNALITNAYDSLGGFMKSLASGSLSFGDILGSIGGAVSSIWGSVKSAASSIVSSLTDKNKSVTQQLASALQSLDNSTHFSSALKGMLEAQLGRPSIYALDSLLSGDNVGLWHLTIGNPKNPIASIGNLILTNASITQSGPLGIDDFPTEIKVSITLKQARSRDLSEISRIYTKGTKTIYLDHKYDNMNSLFEFSDDISKALGNKKFEDVYDTALSNMVNANNELAAREQYKLDEDEYEKSKKAAEENSSENDNSSSNDASTQTMLTSDLSNTDETTSDDTFKSPYRRKTGLEGLSEDELNRRIKRFEDLVASNSKYAARFYDSSVNTSERQQFASFDNQRMMLGSGLDNFIRERQFYDEIAT